MEQKFEEMAEQFQSMLEAFAAAVNDPRFIRALEKEEKQKKENFDKALQEKLKFEKEKAILENKSLQENKLQLEEEEKFLLAQYPETWKSIKPYWDEIENTNRLSPINFLRSWSSYINRDTNNSKLFPFVYKKTDLPKSICANKTLLLMAAELNNVPLCINLLDKEELFENWSYVLDIFRKFHYSESIVALLKWHTKNMPWLKYTPSYRTNNYQEFFTKVLLPWAVKNDYPEIVDTLCKDWDISISDKFVIAHIFVKAIQTVENTSVWSQSFIDSCQSFIPSQRVEIVETIVKGYNADGVLLSEQISSYYSTEKDIHDLPYLALLDDLKRYPKFEAAVSKYYQNIKLDNSTLQTYLEDSQQLLLLENITLGNLKGAQLKTQKNIKITSKTLKKLANHSDFYIESDPLELSKSQESRQICKNAIVLKYLLQHNTALIESAIQNSQQQLLINSVARIGYTEALKYLMQFPAIQNTVDFEEAIKEAVTDGHLDTILFLKGFLNTELRKKVVLEIISSEIDFPNSKDGYFISALLDDSVFQKEDLDHLLKESLSYGNLPALQSLWAKYQDCSTNSSSSQLNGGFLLQLTIKSIKKAVKHDLEEKLDLASFLRIGKPFLETGKYLLDKKISIPSWSIFKDLYTLKNIFDPKRYIYDPPIVAQESFHCYLEFMLTMLESLLNENFDVEPWLKNIIGVLKKENTPMILYQLFIEETYTRLNTKIDSEAELEILQEAFPTFLKDQNLPLIERFVNLKKEKESLSIEDLDAIEENCQKDAGKSFRVWIQKERENLLNPSIGEGVSVGYRP